MMRAARRKRNPDPEPTSAGDPAAAPQAVVSEPVTPEIVPDAVEPGGLSAEFEIAAMNASADTDGEPVPEPEPVPKKELISILDRRPEQPLTDDERRLRAAKNVVAVAEALTKYRLEKGTFPPPRLKNSRGFETVSWRVLLLPYLGYQELHDKFDLQERWNRPPNDALLKFIPDEYVSPERFDTKTNLMVPIAGDDLAFNPQFGRAASEFEDGLENTVILIEADDAKAVQWSEPGDLSFKQFDDWDKWTGNLRGGGTFASWGDGLGVSLSTSLPTQTVWKALTIATNDRLLSGSIHRDLPTKAISEAAIVSTETNSTEPTNVPPTETAPAVVEMPVRKAVPIPGELSEGQRRLEKLLQNRFGPSATAQQKADFARTLLSDRSSSDVAVDEYLFQGFALQSACQAADLRLLLDAINQRVLHFEVDPYDENKRWLLEFGEGGTVSFRNVDGSMFCRRAIRVIYAGWMVDDYDSAGELARVCSKFVTTNADIRTNELFGQLRAALGIARREYAATIEAIDQLRYDEDDEDAARKVGMFLCFYKGEWTRGLEMLKESSIASLASIAQLDLAGGTTPEDRILIADRWFDLASGARTRTLSDAAAKRSQTWYESVVDVLPNSLELLRVRARLRELEKRPQRNPLLLLEELAAAYGADLNQSLASIAVPVATGQDDG